MLIGSVIIMKRVLYIKRKGFNYYTDYTELYLHNAFQKFGYNLVRDPIKSSFCVTVFISEAEKYMAFLSPYFDSLSDDDLISICEKFSAEFKSEAVFSLCKDDMKFSGEKETFMFSDRYSAFDEPVYLTDEKPELTIKTADTYFTANKPYLIRFVNTGGELSGIDVILDFYESTDKLIIDEAEIIYYENKKEFRKALNFRKDSNSFTAEADFVNIKEGINQNCAVLRAKKLFNEELRHGFTLLIRPESYRDTVYTPTLRILSSGEEIFNQVLHFPHNPEKDS